MGGISVILVTGAFTILMIAIIFSIIYFIINYIFESISVFSISRRLNYRFPILTFIPCYSKYILGKFANKNKQGIILAILNILIFILIFIRFYFSLQLTSQAQGNLSFAAMLLLIVDYIFNICLYHNIYKKITPKVATVLTILNLFTIGFAKSIILFNLRKKYMNNN